MDKNVLYKGAMKELEWIMGRTPDNELYQKMERFLWVVIDNAYSMGYSVNAKLKPELGDEVCSVNSAGDVETFNTFIVTEYDEDQGYIGGITLGLDTHSHCEEGVLDHWVKTGRRIDLDKLKQYIKDNQM